MKVKRLFSLAAVAAVVSLPSAVLAQDKVEASVGADVVSSYIWRGQNLGSAAVQPGVSVSWKGLSLGAWGSYGFADKDDTKEFDLTLSYTVGGFTVGVTDYYFDQDDDYYKARGKAAPRYFMYEAHKTAHVFEAFVGYDFGSVAFNWYTNIGGADGVDEDGDRAYSSYFELSAPFKLGGLDWKASVGAVPWETDFYSKVSGFAVTNITLGASKEIQITDKFSLPLSGSVTFNPCQEKAYLTAAISF